MNEKTGSATPFVKWAGVGVILLVIGLLGLSIYHFYGKGRVDLAALGRAKTEPERIKMLNGYDKAHLSDRNSKPGEVFAALVRLAQQNDPVGLQEALSRQSSEVKVIREGVAAALGYYEDKDSLESLAQLLKDPERSVRIQAIYSLSRKQTPSREKLLNEVLNRKDLESDEKIASYASVLQFSRSNETKSAVIGKMADEIQKSKDVNQKLQGILILTQSGVRDPKINELLRVILMDKSAQPLVPLAIRSLSVRQDPWLAKEKNLLPFTKNKEAPVRSAILQSIHQLCPEKRWEILDNMFNAETEPRVIRAAIEALRVMPGIEAETLAKRWLSSDSTKQAGSQPGSQTGSQAGAQVGAHAGAMKSSEVEYLKSILPQLKKAAGVDPCSKPNKSAKKKA